MPYEKRNINKEQKKPRNTSIEVPLYLPDSIPDEVYNGILEVLAGTRFDKISFPLSVYRHQVSEVAKDDTRVITAGYIRKYDQKNNKFTIVLFNGMKESIMSLKDLAIIVNYTSYKDTLGTITKLIVVGEQAEVDNGEGEPDSIPEEASDAK